MPDITMCEGQRMTEMRVQEVCPLREGCYRHKATPSTLRQSFFVRAPWEGKTCSQHTPVVEEPPKKKRAVNIVVSTTPDT